MIFSRRKFIQGLSSIATAVCVPGMAKSHPLTAGAGQGLNYRPWNYGPQGRAVWPRYGGLTGRRRVAEVQRILTEYSTAWRAYAPEWASRLAHEELTEAERRVWCQDSEHWGWLHAWDGDSPVEIASIRLLSTFGETISIYAEPTTEGIRYTITEDSDLDEVIIQAFEFSSLPLTLAELIRLIDCSQFDGFAFSGGLVLSHWEREYEVCVDPLEASKFTKIRSIFYPELAEHYRRVAESRKAELTDDEDA